jgi:hypothetical protein
MLVHIPSEPISEQLLQVPTQSMLQHTPSAEQTLDLHSALSVHDCPLSFLPHRPPMHLLGLVHWLSSVHDVKQPVPVALHLNAPHGVTLPAVHIPVPLHVEAAVAVPLAQLAAEQIAPLAYLRHLPEPSQKPSLPQLDGISSLQLPVGSVPPPPTTVHVPAVEGSAHEKQLAVQLVAQHTPCEQKPEAHSSIAEHDAAMGFFPHDPIWQT